MNGSAIRYVKFEEDMADATVYSVRAYKGGTIHLRKVPRSNTFSGQYHLFHKIGNNILCVFNKDSCTAPRIIIKVERGCWDNET